jgi:hypothetical protein
MAGIADSDSYFYLDMANENSYVYAQSCMNQIENNEQPCSEAPLLMKASYEPSQQTYLFDFTDEEFSGYIGSGEAYLD